MRPAMPGTERIAVHFPSLASRKKAVLVMASEVFFWPIPMKEKSKSFPRTLSMATALLEIGSGSGSTPESAAADSPALKRSNKKNARSLFIHSQVVYPENSTRRGGCQLRTWPGCCRAGLECKRETGSHRAQPAVVGAGRFAAGVFWPVALGGDHPSAVQHAGCPVQGNSDRE